MTLRRAVSLLAALAVLAVAGYTAYWFHVAGQLRKGIDGWAQERRAVGWQVTWSGLAIGGYPVRVEARMAEPALESPAGWRWRTDTLAADASPFDLTLVKLRAPGAHWLAWGEMQWNAATVAADAELDLDRDGRIEVASAVITGLSLTPPAGEPWSVAALALILDPLAVAQPTHDTPTLAFSASAQGIGLPPLPGLVLGREIALAEISGRVMGPIPPGPPMPALAVWSANGGTLEIDRLAVDWQPMGMEASGTLAFDPAMQPLAALSAKVRGFGPLMDRLAAQGVVDQGAASAAKLLLSLMSKPDARGRPAVPVPVTLQDGALYLGPAKVGTVAPIQWPDQR